MYRQLSSLSAGLLCISSRVCNILKMITKSGGHLISMCCVMLLFPILGEVC